MHVGFITRVLSPFLVHLWIHLWINVCNLPHNYFVCTIKAIFGIKYKATSDLIFMPEVKYVVVKPEILLLPN